MYNSCVLALLPVAEGQRIEDSAVQRAVTGENGYWKSRVKLLLVDLPN